MVHHICHEQRTRTRRTREGTKGHSTASASASANKHASFPHESRPCRPKWHLKNYRILPQCCGQAEVFNRPSDIKNTTALAELVCQVSLTAALNLFHGDCETSCHSPPENSVQPKSKTFSSNKKQKLPQCIHCLSKISTR